MLERKYSSVIESRVTRASDYRETGGDDVKESLWEEVTSE